MTCFVFNKIMSFAIKVEGYRFTVWVLIVNEFKAFHNGLWDLRKTNNKISYIFCTFTWKIWLLSFKFSVMLQKEFARNQFMPVIQLYATTEKEWGRACIECMYLSLLIWMCEDINLCLCVWLSIYNLYVCALVHACMCVCDCKYVIVSPRMSGDTMV